MRILNNFGLIFREIIIILGLVNFAIAYGLLKGLGLAWILSLLCCNNHLLKGVAAAFLEITYIEGYGSFLAVRHKGLRTHSPHSTHQNCFEPSPQ